MQIQSGGFLKFLDYGIGPIFEELVFDFRIGQNSGILGLRKIEIAVWQKKISGLGEMLKTSVGFRDPGGQRDRD